MKQMIQDLAPKEVVDSFFIVKYIAVMTGKDGRSYLNIILSDASGELECRKWTDAEETINSVDRGDTVHVTGKVNLFQNRLQLIIKTICRTDQEVDRADLVSTSAVPAEEMLDELDSIIAEMEDVYLQKLLQLTLHDSEIRRRLKTWCAAKSIHHAYEGGLLEHTLSCTRLANYLAPIYGVNKSYVIAGTVLHDLCKIYELSDGDMVEYTEEGKLVGHLVKSIELLDRFASRIENFPYDMKLHLKHILVSHHGELEYGSAKLPQTSEAMLVHLIDLMDSKMATFAAIKKRDLLPGHWSGYVKHLDRLVYKSELPTYTSFIEQSSETKKVVAENKQSTKSKKDRYKQEQPSSNLMAEKLKGFKL